MRDIKGFPHKCKGAVAMASIVPARKRDYNGRVIVLLTEEWERKAAIEQETFSLCMRVIDTRMASKIVAAIYNSRHNKRRQY
jgi:hypothetical protein